MPYTIFLWTRSTNPWDEGKSGAEAPSCRAESPKGLQVRFIKSEALGYKMVEGYKIIFVLLLMACSDFLS